MAFIDIVGFVAAACTTISFLPQVIKIFRSRDVSSISLRMYALFTFGVATWLAFGILKTDWPIIVANGITLVLATFILVYKIRYK